MNNPTFETTTHAKAILTGEHAVIRGMSALVLPLTNETLKLRYFSKRKNSLQADCVGPYGEPLLIIFWHTMNKALDLTHKSFKDIPGYFLLENHIPIGAGIGFSAALCVAIAKWFLWMGWIPEDSLFKFSRNLEHLFHGKSSGVDIAGVIANKVVRYKINQIFTEITPCWQPKLYLSFTKHPSITLKCVKEVEHLWKSNQLLAKRLDLDMQESVETAEAGLQMPENDGLPKLQHALTLAKNCFESWNLISHEMRDHMAILNNAGAIAEKPTGAGHGGYVLSLWNKEPPLKQIPFEMLYVPVNL